MIIWFAVILICFILLLFYPLTVKIVAGGDKTELTNVDIYWLPFVKQKWQWGLPLNKIGKRKKAEPKKLLKLKDQGKILNQAVKRLRIKEFFLELELGLEDPALTGICGGFLGAALGTSLAVFSQKVKEFPPLPHYQISPVYHKNQLSWRANCIVSMSLGDIIKSGLGALRIYLKRGK